MTFDLSAEANMPVQISSLLDATHVDRKLRAYAYLTASFQERGNVHDALDCLTPFVIAALAQQSGSYLKLEEAAAFVGSLGLRIPVYVLEQFTSRLVAKNYLTWDNFAKRFKVSKIDQASFESGERNDSNITEAFEALESHLRQFALCKGFEQPPISANWSDALIHFLKSEQASELIRSIDVKGALIGDALQIETFIVALFIQECEAGKPGLFTQIVTVFTGILIEDFIGNIQVISDPNTFSRLSIYYDTTVLLRILGTSGKLLQTATMEMHRTLQDLGCKTYYFDFTEVETSKVLGALISAYDLGDNIYNETAEAIYNGELTISEVRDIAVTLSVRLGALNIFPFIYNTAARKAEDSFQIDENRFAETLMSSARVRDRTYKKQNADTDARSVAIVFRLRRGFVRREVSASNHLFVSRNSLLQRVARKFAIEHVDEYDDFAAPTVLTVGQITTIAWISSAKKLEPRKVSKELLAACYSAVKPSPGWAEEFSRALARFKVENPAFTQEKANQHFFLQTARSMAKDESLGQAAVLRKINLADIFQDAAEAAGQREAANQLRIKELEERIRELEASDQRFKNETPKSDAPVQGSFDV